MAELHAIRIPAMLSADSDLQFGPGLSPADNRPLNQHAHTGHVERLKRITLEYSRLLLVNIARQETPGIIPRKAHRRLRQIVCAKREEFRNFRNLLRHQ